ncbi:hypothetical protein [Nonomuraea glycinis]|uniref:hypothetical protein n=1 Tax=Nonomuraea glycinis TaxID=2047744 RepID=UPI0033B4B5A7
MGRIVLDVSMSLDGFTTGPNVREAEPMGDGGERLHARHAGELNGGCRDRRHMLSQRSTVRCLEAEPWKRRRTS